MLTSEPRECRIVGTAKHQGNASPLIQVLLLRPVELEVRFSSQVIQLLLLAPFASSQAGDLEKGRLTAGIFIPRDDDLRDAYDAADLVAHPGTGQLHLNWADAARKCAKPLLGNPIQVPISSIRVLGEQDGEPERFLKSRIVEFLERAGCQCRAYLARAEYVLSGEVHVLLCVRLKSGDAVDLVNSGIGNIFRETFRTDQHLDVLFVTQREEEDIAATVRPFFNSME